MRIPIAYLIATLVVVAAGSVVITFYAKQSEYVVNATGLAVGQFREFKMDNYAPAALRLYGDVGAAYIVAVKSSVEAYVYPRCTTETANMVYRIDNSTEYSVYVPLEGTNNATVCMPRVEPRSAPFAIYIRVLRIS